MSSWSASWVPLEIEIFPSFDQSNSTISPPLGTVCVAIVMLALLMNAEHLEFVRVPAADDVQAEASAADLGPGGLPDIPSP